MIGEYKERWKLKCVVKFVFDSKEKRITERRRMNDTLSSIRHIRIVSTHNKAENRKNIFICLE